MNSNYTGRFPRTLQETRLGPYARWDIERKPPFWQRHIILMALVLFFATVGVSIAVEVM